jgi:hypothetical protein
VLSERSGGQRASTRVPPQIVGLTENHCHVKTICSENMHLESIVKLKYLLITVTNQNYSNEEIKRKSNLRMLANIHLFLLQLKIKNLNIKHAKVCTSVELGFSFWRCRTDL